MAHRVSLFRGHVCRVNGVAVLLCSARVSCVQKQGCPGVDDTTGPSTAKITLGSLCV